MKTGIPAQFYVRRAEGLLKRKSIEPMAVAVAGSNTRSEAMQQFISQGAWSDDGVLAIHRRAVAETLGRAGGVVTRSVDGCDFPKQGADSVGVARQYCGLLGTLRVANGQASVVLAYASELGATLLDRRLYLPHEWFDAEHRDQLPGLGWELAPSSLITATAALLDFSMGQATLTVVISAADDTAVRIVQLR